MPQAKSKDIRCYLGIQAMIVSRMVRRLGVVSLFCLAFISLLLLIISKMQLFVAPLIFSLLILVYQMNRGDAGLLHTLLGKKFWRCYFVHYMIISLPFLLISLLKGRYVEVAVYPIAAFAVSLLPRKHIHWHIPTHPLFPRGSYEYQSGFRRAIALYVILFGFAVVGGIFSNVRLSMIATAANNMLLFSFYSIPARREYLLNYHTAKRLFLTKSRDIVACNTILLIPFFALLLTFRFSGHMVIACLSLYLSGILLMSQVLCLRILFGDPDFLMILLGVALIIFSLICVPFPVLLSVSMFIAVGLFFPAYQNINRIIRR